jgi:hypothetical protein
VWGVGCGVWGNREKTFVADDGHSLNTSGVVADGELFRLLLLMIKKFNENETTDKHR